MSRPWGIASICHPDKPRTTADGLCKSCYDKLKYDEKCRASGKVRRGDPVPTWFCSIHENIEVTETRRCKRCLAIEYEAANKDRLTIYRREWADKNRETVNLKSLDRRRQKLFGVSPEVAARMLTNQGGLCLICSSDGGGRTLHLDHCHSTLKVRGLLCQKCNQGLGLFGDSPELLEAAAAYLREHDNEENNNETL